MTPTEISALRPGDGLIIEFGRFGTQYAIFCRHSKAALRNGLVVRKWRKTSGRWTSHRVIFPGEVKRHAEPADLYPTFGPHYGAILQQAQAEA